MLLFTHTAGKLFFFISLKHLMMKITSQCPAGVCGVNLRPTPVPIGGSVSVVKLWFVDRHSPHVHCAGPVVVVSPGNKTTFADVQICDVQIQVCCKNTCRL